jgi:hypothetical protein
LSRSNLAGPPPESRIFIARFGFLYLTLFEIKHEELPNLQPHLS